MGFKLDRVHVWSVEVADQAGGVANKLSLLAQAGTNLEYIYTRRKADKPGYGVLYVAPISGPLQVRAARSAGLHEVDDPVVVRVEGDNEAGLCHRVTQEWAKANVSFQGMTMSVLGDKFVGYVAFDTVADANKAAAILSDLGGQVANEIASSSATS
jgi:glycine cleavage system regulatory protein